MPAEYLACVRSEEERGKSHKDAQRICAIAYYKRHGKTPQQAEEEGADELDTAGLDIEAIRAAVDGGRAVIESGDLSEFVNARFNDLEIVTEEAGKQLPQGVIMRVRGTALIDEVVSQRGRGRYYSKEFNDRCLEETLQYMAQGGVATMFGRHGRAVQPNRLAEGIPCGRITEAFREDNKIKYVASIIDTTDGRDVAVAVRTGTMPGTSVRFHHAATRRVRLNGADVEQMVSGHINGIDFTDEPGIEGAGVDAVLESLGAAPRIENEEGTMTVEWTKVTLEDLIKNVKPLLDEFAATAIEASDLGNAKSAAEAQVATLTQEKAALSAQVADFQSKASDAVAALEELKLRQALAEASLIGAGRAIYARLQTDVKNLEELSAKLPAIRAEALSAFLVSASKGAQEVPAGGNGNPPAETESGAAGESGEGGEGITEEQERMLALV